MYLCPDPSWRATRRRDSGKTKWFASLFSKVVSLTSKKKTKKEAPF